MGRRRRKITKITPDQAARFREWADKWIAIGLSTEPADFERATDAALRAYKICNLDRPMVILHMSSPYGATLGGALAWAMLSQVGSQVGIQVESQVWSQVWSQVGIQVESQVWSQVGIQVESQVWSQVESQVRSQVWNQVGIQVESQVGSQVESQVGSQVWSQVWSQVESQVGSQVMSQVRGQVRSQVESQVVGSQVGSQVWSQVWSQVMSQVESQVESQVGSQVMSQVGSQVGGQARNSVHNYRGGSFWASWAAYVSFIRDVLGWQDPVLDRFEIDETLVRSCGWVWWHENVLAISDRPSVINRDSEGRLHCEVGPSIAYRDGWSLWHVHGVAVPQYVIERPHEITVEKIDSETNAEVRRVMIDRYHLGAEISGAAAYIRDGGGKRLDHDERFGTLWHRDVSDDEPIVMLEVVNSTREPDGSFKRYWLRVPPNMRTAHEASAWTFGLEAAEYAPQIET
jgi:hypothetical protein